VEKEWTNTSNKFIFRILLLFSKFMAVSRNNPLTHGASGMIGGTVVFRTWNGKTFMYNRPKKPSKQSQQQKENRLKFKMATQYAKNMMKDPAKKAEYQKIAKREQLPNAYTAAITEYMRRPEIKEIDLTGYSGKEHEEIKVETRKKGFEVAAVEVVISNSKGQVVEQGSAVLNKTGKWIYTSSKRVNGEESLQILVRARERTGNYVDKRVSKSLTEGDVGIK
jgi:hypothetical protein